MSQIQKSTYAGYDNLRKQLEGQIQNFNKTFSQIVQKVDPEFNGINSKQGNLPEDGPYMDGIRLSGDGKTVISRTPYTGEEARLIELRGKLQSVDDTAFKKINSLVSTDSMLDGAAAEMSAGNDQKAAALLEMAKQSLEKNSK